MSELKQMIEQRKEAYAESLREPLTDASAAVALVRDAAKATHDKLRERNESEED